MSKKRTDSTMGKLLLTRSAYWSCVVYPNLSGINEEEQGVALTYGKYYLTPEPEVYPENFSEISDAHYKYMGCCDDNVEKCIDRLKSSNTNNIALVLHDKDKNEIGDFKKAHYHIIKRFDKAVTAKYAQEWLSRTFGDCFTDTSVNAFKPIENIDGAEKYLHHDGIETHKYKDGKYGYPKDEVIKIGRIVPIGYAEFMTLVFSSEGFLDLCHKCAASDEMAKMLVKNSYFAKSYYSALKNGD